MDDRVTGHQRKEVLNGFLRKAEQFKYPALMLLIGIIILLLPGVGDQTAETDMTAPVETKPQAEPLDRQLEKVLTEIEGAGSVRVLLTMETDVQTEYQQDQDRRIHGEETELHSETVLISENGNQVPIAVKRSCPVYKGAVVVCQGADSAAVRLNIVRAVSSLTGLGSDKITVLKMKG